jgi:hypothetical protein
VITQKRHGSETHDIMTLQENKYKYKAKSNFNFSMNDMSIKTVQFSISTLQFRSKMQSSTKCTKLMIKIQKTKNAKQCKMPIFCIFNILKIKCMD